jgi:hypothetical protein
MIPFGERRLRYHFQLDSNSKSGTFNSSGSKNETFEGLRSECQIVGTQLPNTGSATAAIYGLSLDQMNKLTVAGTQWEGHAEHQVTIQASTRGEASEDGWTTIFNGRIIGAFPAMNTMPMTPLVVIATPGKGVDLQMKPVKPISVEGSASAGDLIERAAKQAGFQVENNNVNAQLSNPYLKGVAMEQIKRTLSAADALGTISLVENKISIWPRNGERKGQTPTISARTGMIGYPEFEKVLVIVRVLFDPSIIGVVEPGMKFKVESDITAANGTWNTVQITLHLSSETPGGGQAGPGGPWEMILIGSRSQ